MVNQLFSFCLTLFLYIFGTCFYLLKYVMAILFSSFLRIFSFTRVVFGWIRCPFTHFFFFISVFILIDVAVLFPLSVPFSLLSFHQDSLRDIFIVHLCTWHGWTFFYLIPLSMLWVSLIATSLWFLGSTGLSFGGSLQVYEENTCGVLVFVLYLVMGLHTFMILLSLCQKLHMLTLSLHLI